MLASQNLKDLELSHLSPSLVEQFCRSLTSRPEAHDPEFPNVFPAPDLARLDLFGGDPHSMRDEAGRIIRNTLERRRSQLRALAHDRRTGLISLKFSGGFVDCLDVLSWSTLVDEKEGRIEFP